MVRRRVVALAVALAFALGGSLDVFAQDRRGGSQQQQQQPKRSKQEQMEIDQLVRLVDGIMAGQPAPNDVQLTLHPYFLKSQEQRTFVPFVVAVNGAPATETALYVRVVNPEAYAAAKDKKKFEYPWDDIHFLPAGALPGGTGRLSRVFMAAPGTYDVYIGLKERLSEKAPKNQVAKVGVIKTQVTVPDFWNGELAMSSVIAADKVNTLTAPLGPEEARERPFVFGLQELQPASDPVFLKSENLATFFQVYNAGLDPAGKPNIVMEYNFYRKEGAEEKFFNKTNPQTINASNLPPTFDPSKFPIPGGIDVPLATFPEGDFRLEIKVVDKVTGKTITQNVNFTVKAAA